MAKQDVPPPHEQEPHVNDAGTLVLAPAACVDAPGQAIPLIHQRPDGTAETTCIAVNRPGRNRKKKDQQREQYRRMKSAARSAKAAVKARYPPSWHAFFTEFKIKVDEWDFWPCFGHEMCEKARCEHSELELDAMDMPFKKISEEAKYAFMLERSTVLSKALDLYMIEYEADLELEVDPSELDFFLFWERNLKVMNEINRTIAAVADIPREERCLCQYRRTLTLEDAMLINGKEEKLDVPRIHGRAATVFKVSPNEMKAMVDAMKESISDSD